MRKFSVMLLLLLLTATSVYAVNFTPSPLKLSAAQEVVYDFDGSLFQLPVVVSGSQASVFFCVFTKDKASSVKKVKNGFLGWHYVNNIDTCLYMSSAYDMARGEGMVSWDGKDDDKNMVPAGDYTYYLWGYNSQSPRTLACSIYGAQSNSAGMIQQYDAQNNILPNPVYYPPAQSIPQLAAANGGWDSSSNPGLKTRARWALGSDPKDANFVETTTYSGWGDSGKLALMPGDHQYYYVENYLPKSLYPEGLHHVMKFKWVPNGQSEQVYEFGEDGMLTFNNTSAGYAGPITDNVDNLWLVVGDNSYPTSFNPEVLYYVDLNDGTTIRQYDFS